MKSAADTVRLAPQLTPHGRLLLTPADDAEPLADDLAERLREAFDRGSGHGLLQLGASEVDTPIPAALGYWRELASRCVAAICALPEPQARTVPPLPPPDPHELDELAAAAPLMPGSEYITADVLDTLWNATADAFRVELGESGLSVEHFLARRSPAWHVVGRVHFNLAENRRDEEAPFAFLATYTTRLSPNAKPRHVPLGHALREYAGAANKSRLLSLLLPVQRAAEHCSWLQAMVQAGEIFHPLRWTAAEALQFLDDVPRLEAAGVIVRVPGAWRGSRPPRPQVTITVGAHPASGLGSASLLDFDMRVTLDGEPLTPDEVASLTAASDGLHLVRGHWVEINAETLTKVLDQFRAIERAAADSGLGFAQAMRLLAGASLPGDELPPEAPDWSRVVAGPWLARTLDELKRPEALARVDPGTELKATLRPYQEVGVRWLHLLSSLGLGACLADDMGLGKTMQVLALLLILRQREADARRTSLLVAPASLLANWAAEIERFAPTLRVMVAHSSSIPATALQGLEERHLGDVDLVITSYGSLVRAQGLARIPWRLAVLDEAQAIKNPGARQTQAVKQLDATARIALTGTPVENRVGDLWSIFDFVNPGLLGSARDFSEFTKRLASQPHNPYGPLRQLVRPYILRRLKTDKSVIADLPDKTEVTAFCLLARRQAALYQQSVKELEHALANAEGIARKGLVLAFLMRFKQICNHPSHWLGDGRWAEDDSGKFARLREIVEVVAARQEKALVFTQFRELAAPLASYLEKLFGRAGLVLHGGTPVKARQALVKRFQEDERVPFFVLSLKAGGTGLNLTAASHVIHFDRWWNPAVESQATDRAFRIGQTKNVLVHKFVSRGTVEERIDELMTAKRQLSEGLIESGADVLLTEMSNDELLELVALDLRSAAGE